MFLFSNFESDAPTVLANGRAYNAPLAKLLFANALKMTMLPCWAYVIGLGVNEKVQNTGERMPIFTWALT